MSKSTTRSGGYRREYSAELRASMAKCSNSSRRGRRHLGVVAVTLVAVTKLQFAVRASCNRLLLRMRLPKLSVPLAQTVKTTTRTHQIAS